MASIMIYPTVNNTKWSQCGDPHCVEMCTKSIMEYIDNHTGTRLTEYILATKAVVSDTIAGNHPSGTIRWINVEMKFRTTSRRYFNYISTLFQRQMPAGQCIVKNE